MIAERMARPPFDDDFKFVSSINSGENNPCRLTSSSLAGNSTNDSFFEMNIHIPYESFETMH